MAKLQSLSAAHYRQELVDAAKRTFCFRQTAIQMRKPSFASCVAEMSCYASVPQIVSLLVCPLSTGFFCYKFYCIAVNVLV
jgi:hypothetical protein